MIALHHAHSEEQPVKIITALAAAAVTAALALILTAHGTPGCQAAGHRLPVNATIAVDAAGNASSPYNGTGTGYECTRSGAWVRI